MSESVLEECVIEETSDEFKYLLDVGEEGLPGDFIFEEVISPIEIQTDCNIAITNVCSLSGNRLCDEKSKNVKSRLEKPACIQEKDQIVQEQVQFKQERVQLKQEPVQFKQEQDYIEQDQIELEQIEQEHVEQEQIEQEQIEREQIEQEQIEQEQIEQEQIEQEQIEPDHIEQEEIEQEHVEQEQIEQEQIELDQIEQEEIEQEQVEQDQIEQEQIEQELDQMVQEQDHIVPEQDHIEQTEIVLEQDQIIVQEQEQIELSPSKNTEDVNDESDRMEESEDAVIHSDPLLSCSDIEFKMTFRVSRSSFEKILAILSKEKFDEIENVPLHKRLLIFLWLMGSFTSFSDAADTLKVTEDEASDSFYSVCTALSNKTDSFVRWPDSDEREKISSRVETNYGIDGVVGILSVHYCPLYIPKESAMRRSYFNVSMKLYCVALQLVIDDKFFIRDVFAGQPGSFRQDVVMRLSPLASQLNCTPCTLVENHRHVLARAGLPQLQTTLTPLVGSNLSPAEIRLNQQIESACCLADEVYHTLRLRFSILTLLDINEAIGILQAACVLHNICLTNGDFFQS